MESDSVQIIPTPSLYVLLLIVNPDDVKILGYGEAPLSNTGGDQTLSFGVTLASVPSTVIVWGITAAGSVNWVGVCYVDGSATITDFDVLLLGAPGNTTSKCGWLALL